MRQITECSHRSLHGNAVYVTPWHGVRGVGHCDTERDDWEHAPAVWKHIYGFGCETHRDVARFCRLQLPSIRRLPHIRPGRKRSSHRAAALDGRTACGMVASICRNTELNVLIPARVKWRHGSRGSSYFHGQPLVAFRIQPDRFLNVRQFTSAGQSFAFPEACQPCSLAS